MPDDPELPPAFRAYIVDKPADGEFSRGLREVASFVSERLATVHGVISTATHFLLKPYKEQGVLMRYEQAEERLAVTP